MSVERRLISRRGRRRSDRGQSGLEHLRTRFRDADLVGERTELQVVEHPDIPQEVAHDTSGSHSRIAHECGADPSFAQRRVHEGFDRGRHPRAVAGNRNGLIRASHLETNSAVVTIMHTARQLRQKRSDVERFA